MSQIFVFLVASSEEHFMASVYLRKLRELHVDHVVYSKENSINLVLIVHARFQVSSMQQTVLYRLDTWFV